MLCTKRIICFCLSFVLLFSFSACAQKDYSGEAHYRGFFLNTDTEADRDIKNFIIGMLVYYNHGSYSKYINCFDRERSDKRSFVRDTKETAKLMSQTYNIKGLTTAILDGYENNAQAGVTAIITITNTKTGEIAEQYQCNITYTLSKDSGEWLVTEDSIDGESIDYLT